MNSSMIKRPVNTASLKGEVAIFMVITAVFTIIITTITP